MSVDFTFATALEATYARLRAGLAANERGYEWRMKQLRALKSMIEENDAELTRAMWQDLRKSEFECAATEQGVVISEIDYALKRLKKWMRPHRVATPLYNQLGRSRIVHDPLGLTLIIGAWNYPINLLLTPLAGAICGGNGAIIKPSEISAATAAVISRLVPKYLDSDLFAVIEGGAEETSAVLDQRFDLIFFTGSGPVGKIVLAKAAVHLTPTVLELGGKSPAIILPDADVATSAHRIAWGKFMNAGQTCVAPDYVIVHSSVRDRFVGEMKSVIKRFYGNDVKASPDYCRIVNERNFDRLAKLADGLRILHGGETDRDARFIAPTIVEASVTDAIMNEEIFGPYLPVLEMSDIDEMKRFVNARPKPLALYLFTNDRRTIESVVSGTSSGAVCVNDVVMHMPVPSLPFGGVGDSGMGAYHGPYSFSAFTHAKGVLHKSLLFDPPVRYPPYSSFKAKCLKWLFR